MNAERKSAFVNGVRNARSDENKWKSVKRKSPLSMARLAYNSSRIEGVPVSKDRLNDIARSSQIDR
jgi:hypothetical protein